MCGILGDINFNGINKSVFERQLEVIHHRGPDSTGIWHNSNETVFLGSKRYQYKICQPMGLCQ